MCVCGRRGNELGVGAGSGEWRGLYVCDLRRGMGVCVCAWRGWGDIDTERIERHREERGEKERGD